MRDSGSSLGKKLSLISLQVNSVGEKGASGEQAVMIVDCRVRGLVGVERVHPLDLSPGRRAGMAA